MIIPQNQRKTNSCRQKQYFPKRPHVHTSWAERYTCLLVKKLPLWAAQKRVFHSACFTIEAWKKTNFCGINFCDVGILWKKMLNLFLKYHCFNKFFLTKSKKEDMIHMGIIYMSFLSRNLLRKNIYTMSSLMWSNELFSLLKWWLYLYCIFLSSFLTYEVSYSKNINFFRRNAEFIFAIDLSKTVFWGKTFVILGQNHKYKSCKNLFRNSLWSQKFLPQICLNIRKIPKFQ